jgi:hypothetical protein
LTDVLCTRTYAALCSWHRSSLFQLVTVIVYSACMLAFLVKVRFEIDDKVYDRTTWCESMRPLAVLAGLCGTMLCLVRHRNTSLWLPLCLLLIAQYLCLRFGDEIYGNYNNGDKIPAEYICMPGGLAILTLDFFYIKLACSGRRHRWLECSA